MSVVYDTSISGVVASDKVQAQSLALAITGTTHMDRTVNLSSCKAKRRTAQHILNPWPSGSRTGGLPEGHNLTAAPTDKDNPGPSVAPSVAAACSNHPGQSRSTAGQRTDKSHVKHHAERIALNF